VEASGDHLRWKPPAITFGGEQSGKKGIHKEIKELKLNY